LLLVINALAAIVTIIIGVAIFKKGTNIKNLNFLVFINFLIILGILANPLIIALLIMLPAVLSLFFLQIILGILELTKPKTLEQTHKILLLLGSALLYIVLLGAVFSNAPW